MSNRRFITTLGNNRQVMKILKQLLILTNLKYHGFPFPLIIRDKFWVKL